MRWGVMVIAMGVVSGAAVRSYAGDVALRFNTQDVFAGVPFTVAIDVQSKQDFEPPVFPELDNATVERAGQQSSSNSSFQITLNGRTVTRTRSTRFLYRITPQHAGQLVIPPVAVKVDGRLLHTPRRVFTVKKAETSDLLFVELSASKKSVYVGEPVDLTLAVWLRPFSNSRVELDHNQMWGRIDLALSDWGPFADLVERRRPQVSVSYDSRVGTDGRSHRYFVYTLRKQYWPQRSGPLDTGDIRVVVDYPLRIERDNSFFFSNLKVSQSKTLVGVVRDTPVRVKPIPTQGRPPYYSGAVGPHRISASVSPTKARVGDPLTVNLKITGSGRLDLLQPPPIAQLPVLAGKFHVDDDRLPGVVSGRTKTFTLSMRALTPDVTELPAIPFAYFDPVKARFVTVYSDPIPLSIRAAEKMSVTQIVESPTDGRTAVDSLTRLESGIEGNYADPNLVLAQQGVYPRSVMVVALAVPPMAWVACWLGVRLRRRRISDRALVRRRHARREALARVAEARRCGQPVEIASRVGSALLGYVADSFDLPAGSLTRAEAVRTLRDAGADAVLVEGVDRVLADCEAAQFGRIAPGAGHGLTDQVEACITQLEAARL